MMASKRRSTESKTGVPPLGDMHSLSGRLIRAASAGKAAADLKFRADWAIVLSVSWGVLAYVACAAFLLNLLQSSETARASKLYFHEVPRSFYLFSSAAFASAVAINLCAVLYEDSAFKRQAALIQVVIKGLAALVDLQMYFGRPLIVFSQQHQPVHVLRYIHWSVSCPLIIWLVARVAGTPPLKLLACIGAAVVTMLTGLVAAFLPDPWRWCTWGASCVAHVYMLRGLDQMIRQVEKTCSNESSRAGLRSIRYSTHVLWNIFPVADGARELGLLPRATVEACNLIANFWAKIIFSSTVMYANFVSLAERQRQAEALERQMAIANQALIQELQRALEAKSEFMSMMSHELNTPLNGMIGLSEAMLGEGPWQPLGDLGLKYLRTIKASSVHLASLIRDILDSAAASHGTLGIQLQKVHLGTVLADVMDTVSQLAKKSVQLVSHVDPELPTIAGDKKRLTQILYNLLGNALKFTSRGGVTVDVLSDHINDKVIISVKDSGCGIPADKLEDIFQPFHQGDSSTTRNYGGTGLGLSIVSRLVAAHHGTIAVSSKPGTGSTFTVTLPIRQTDDSQCSSPQSSAPASPRSFSQEPPRARLPPVAPAKGRQEAFIAKAADKTRKRHGPQRHGPQRVEVSASAVTNLSRSFKRTVTQVERATAMGELASSIPALEQREPDWDSAEEHAVGESLVGGPGAVTERQCHGELHEEALILSIDDEQINHLVIAEILRSQGYALHTETSAQSALTWISEQRLLPDLILLDCMMPGMSGHDFCRELRKTVPASVLPIIMVSAHSSEESIVQGLQSGCNDFVGKPVKRAELLARITAHLRVRAGNNWLNALSEGAMQNNAEAMKILQSILPEAIISRMQEGQRIIGDCHDNVFVLFSDIVGFSTMATHMTPMEVFMLLTNLYSSFDRLTDKFSVYKVETIGDGKCPRYCFIGDTVNMASRMQSTGQPMAVQVSEEVYRHAGQDNLFHALGEREIKGKGLCSTYLVKYGDWMAARDAIKEEASRSSSAPSDGDLRQDPGHQQLQLQLQHACHLLQEERDAHKGTMDRAAQLGEE
ncbi:hypothetical protein WJX73_001889, partial [Symbiochloris irregularis]